MPDGPALACAGRLPSPDPMELTLLPYRPERDVYQLLGVPPSADAAQVGTACRRLARTFHPDRNGSPRATTEMQVVNAVRALLADPASRAEYDRARIIFLARRPAAAAPAAPAHAADVPMPAATAQRASRRAWTRTARAMMAGLVAGLGALTPRRCPRCDASTADDYRFCGECGVALQRGA